MHYNQLIKNLEQNHVPPLTLLVGEEDYLVREVLDHFIRVVVPPESRSFNLDVIDAAESTMERIKDAIGTLPFMGGKRLAVVRNFDKLKGSGTGSGLLSFFENPDPSIVTVITASTLDRKKKLHARLYQSAEVVEMKIRNAREAAAWITKKAQSLNKTIEPKAVDCLLERVGTHLGNLHNEMEKAAAFTGKRNRITEEDLRELVGDLQIDSVFALAEAVGEKNLEKALKCLKNILTHGSHPLAVMGMLARQFRMIWQTKTLVDQQTAPPRIAKAIGAPPYFIDKYIRQSGKFSEEELTLNFRRIKTLDKTLKSSDISPALLLENMLFEFCR